MEYKTFDDLEKEISEIKNDLHNNVKNQTTIAILSKELQVREDERWKMASKGYYSTRHWEIYLNQCIRLEMAYNDAQERKISEEQITFCDEELLPAQIRRLNKRWYKVEEQEIKKAYHTGPPCRIY
ncbi:hypothetical protein [Bacillus bombysepticus]|uniref:hypothetical protein n=1 Tax=Bacillus bombysepticus TaxID=658666 RepID=UPI003018CAE2